MRSLFKMAYFTLLTVSAGFLYIQANNNVDNFKDIMIIAAWVLSLAFASTIIEVAVFETFDDDKLFSFIMIFAALMLILFLTKFTIYKYQLLDIKDFILLTIISIAYTAVFFTLGILRESFS